MEENLKIVHAKNLNKLSFGVDFNILVDTNANVKTVLNVESYLCETKYECGNNKAILSGKACVKVLYLDTDNLTNTLTDTQTFTETYNESSITPNTYLNLGTPTFVNSVLTSEGTIKINCQVNISPIAYTNSLLPNDNKLNETFIARKSEVSSFVCKEDIKTKFEHTTSFETHDKINKILHTNSRFFAEKVTPENNYMVLEGKLFSQLLYETSINDTTIIKELKDISSVKYDVELNGLTQEDKLDLCFMVDNSLKDISTEIEENESIINIKDTINIAGIVLKNLSFEIIDDMFSLQNEIEISHIRKELIKNVSTHNISDTISNEVNLNDNEPAIDEIIANLNAVPEITNSYIKDNLIYVEGFVGSSLSYIDENKETKSKEIEIPFIINTKINPNQTSAIHKHVTIMDSRIKVKRGTIIDIEYSLFINLCVYECETYNILDNYSIGKLLDLNKYDYQIFIAKPEETIWDLCKRIKISQSEITKLNKDLPLIMHGGERIIIKR